MRKILGSSGIYQAKLYGINDRVARVETFYDEYEAYDFIQRSFTESSYAPFYSRGVVCVAELRAFSWLIRRIEKNLDRIPPAESEADISHWQVNYYNRGDRLKSNQIYMRPPVKEEIEERMDELKAVYAVVSYKEIGVKYYMISRMYQRRD